MLHYVILGALVLWSFGTPAATVITCNSQLKDLATEMDEAFSRVVADVEILVAGRGSTSPPVASDPPSSGPTPRTSSVPPFDVPIPLYSPTRQSRSTAIGKPRILRALYHNLTSTRGEAPSDKIYDLFVSAMSDISQEHFKACYGPSNERVRLAEGPSLIEEFNGLSNTSRVHELRAVFAKLLCIRNHNSRAGKRSTTDCLEEFFQSLSDEDFGDVFGFKEVNRFIPTGSLAFAVDTTGSMRDEIQDVRRIIRAFLASEKQEPFYYVLAEFNDYLIDSGQCNLEGGGKNATVYNSRNLCEVRNLVQAIDNLDARGGADCHEYGMAGILKSLDSYIPNTTVHALGADSHVIVLTDAGSKDRIDCKEQAINESHTRSITVHFYLSPSDCLSKPAAADAYEQVANETGGVVVKTPEDFKSIAWFVMAYTNLQTKPNVFPSSGRRKRQTLLTTEQRCHLIKVSAFTTSMALLFNTTKTLITVQKPDRQVIPLPKNNTDVLKFFSVEDPKAGTWTVCVPNGTLSVSSILRTDVKFIVSVLEEGTDAAGNTKYYLASRKPYACTTGTVVVRGLEGNIVNISTSHTLYLGFLDADKSILQEIPISVCNGLFRGTVTFPASMDFLQLRGTDVFGVPFSYIRPAINAPVTFRPSRFYLMPTSGTVSITIGSTKTITYQILAIETEGKTSFEFSHQTAYGFVVVVPAHGVISGNQHLTVSVRVTPTSFVARGNYQITLIATSGCNTLRATQTVTVNPQIAPPVSDQCGGCQNGGTCFSIPWGARVVKRCGCMPGYAGTYCELAI